MPSPATPENLDTITRIASVIEAESAGFIPTTQLEKNSALTLIDYLENPQKFPGGVHDHLMEIYTHQVGVFQEQGKGYGQAQILAKVSVASVLHTYGDHLANARMSFRQLSLVGKLIAETPNPRLSLQTAFDDRHVPRSNIAPLVRYVDQSSFAQNRQWPYLFDPFLTVENRLNPLAGANKRIEDVYTGENERVEKQRVAEFLDVTTLKDVREITQPALQDQVKRGTFWVTCLLGAKGVYKEVAHTILTSADIKLEAA